MGIAHSTVPSRLTTPVPATTAATARGTSFGRVQRNATPARKVRNPGMITTTGMAALYCRWYAAKCSAGTVPKKG